MRKIFIILFLLQLKLIILLNTHDQDSKNIDSLLSQLKNLLNFDNHQSQMNQMKRILHYYQQMDQSQQRLFIQGLDDKFTFFKEFLHNHKLYEQVLHNRPQKFTRIMEMIFKNYTILEEPSDHGIKSAKFKRILEIYKNKQQIFKQLLQELESQYILDNENDWNDYYKQNIYGERSINQLMEYFKMMLGKKQQNSSFYNEIKKKQLQKLSFVKDQHRKQFEVAFNDLIKSKIEMQQFIDKEKSQKQNQTQSEKKQTHSIPNNTQNIFIKNQSIQIEQKLYLRNQKESLQNTKNSFIEISQKIIPDYIKNNQTCKQNLNPDIYNDILTKVENFQKDLENEVEKKAFDNKLIFGGLSNIQSQMAYQIAKKIFQMIPLVIQTLFASLFKKCFPPGPLTLLTCPESGFLPTNLFHFFLFFDKNEIFSKKLEAFPRFYNDYQIWHGDMSVMKYYTCAQAYFTLECSKLWPMCFIPSFLFTNPPFTTDPVLLPFALIAQIPLIPGDKPPCWFLCIQMLLQCPGVKFFDIDSCGGLYNLDSFLRIARGDIPLMVYVLLTFVPTACNYVPFIINMWMVPPPIQTFEQQLNQKVPELQAQIKKDENKTECVEVEKEKPSPFEEGVDISKLSKKISKIINFGDEIYIDQFKRGNYNPNIIKRDYHVIDWEKSMTKPEISIHYEYIKRLIASINQNLNSFDYDEYKKNATILLNDIGNIIGRNNGPYKNKDVIQKILNDQISAKYENNEIHQTNLNKVALDQTEKYRDPNVKTVSGNYGSQQEY